MYGSRSGRQEGIIFLSFATLSAFLFTCDFDHRTRSVSLCTMSSIEEIFCSVCLSFLAFHVIKSLSLPLSLLRFPMESETERLPFSLSHGSACPDSKQIRQRAWSQSLEFERENKESDPRFLYHPVTFSFIPLLSFASLSWQQIPSPPPSHHLLLLLLFFLLFDWIFEADHSAFFAVSFLFSGPYTSLHLLLSITSKGWKDV